MVLFLFLKYWHRILSNCIIYRLDVLRDLKEMQTEELEKIDQDRKQMLANADTMKSNYSKAIERQTAINLRLISKYVTDLFL